MTTAEASTAWNVNKRTVACYCSEGLIPMAFKENRKWIIPNGTNKPPVRRTQAVVLIRDVFLYKEGVRPKRMVDFSVYQYLADNGFITDISNCRNVEDVLKTAVVSTAGLSLIESEERKHKNKKVKTTYSGNANINVGVANAGVSVKHQVEIEK